MTRQDSTADPRTAAVRRAAPARGDHLHFDRRARVWLTHAELLGGRRAAPAREPAFDGGMA